METALWILGAVGFVLALMVTIGVHEWGHMFAARRFGLAIPEFAIGFGKKLIKRTHKGTEYSLRAIPLGGFVLIKDPKSTKTGADAVEEAESMLLSNVAPWKRIIVYLAGPAVNIVIGLTMFTVLFMSATTLVPKNGIESVEQSPSTCATADCGAAGAGIQPGDIIQSVNGEPVVDPLDTSAMLRDALAEGSTVTLVLERDGKTITAPVTAYENADGRSVIGVQLDSTEGHLSLSQSLQATTAMVQMNLEGIARIPSKVPMLWEAVITGERNPETPISVVGATRVSGDQASDMTLTPTTKVQNFAFLVASFNLGIGILNLLPLLPLDGGRIFIALLDSVKMLVSRITRREYKPVGTKFVGALTAAFALLIFSYMGLVILADIVSPVTT